MFSIYKAFHIPPQTPHALDVSELYDCAAVDVLHRESDPGVPGLWFHRAQYGCLVVGGRGERGIKEEYKRSKSSWSKEKCVFLEFEIGEERKE